VNFICAVPTGPRTAGESDRSAAAGERHPERCCGEMLHHQPDGDQVSYFYLDFPAFLLKCAAQTAKRLIYPQNKNCLPNLLDFCSSFVFYIFSGSHQS